jgi:hypothetical protein
VKERIEEELVLLRGRWADIEYLPEGHWFRIREYPLPAGWNRTSTAVAFQPQVSHPGTPPYGIYVPAGLTFNGQRADNYVEPAPAQPPFGGAWGIFSWTPSDGEWRPAADPRAGSNLLNWALGFADRFREGK